MILDDIVEATRIRLAAQKEDTTLLQLERQFPTAPARPFASVLKRPDRLGLIAEIKRASPSKGIIDPDFNHLRQAALYRDAGADCLSVLTEPKFFLGELGYLRDAGIESGKPCLRKDFIIDQWQIAEARVYGADCILLIAAILTDWQLRAFKNAAHQYGMDALVEIHDETEAKRAVAGGCQFIGINNRDLRSFDVDLHTTERLRPLLPTSATVVAESGIVTREDALFLKSVGADALLVGETLMRSTNVNQTVEQLTT